MVSTVAETYAGAGRRSLSRSARGTGRPAWRDDGSIMAAPEVSGPGVTGRVVGREAELAVVDEFVAPLISARALVLVGEPGIGKTTLWEAGIAAARRRALRVLAARPSAAETPLSFATLADLLEGVEVEALVGLPAPQRHALQVALLRAEPEWMDSASADALVFAARRLEGEAIGFLLARRPGGASRSTSCTPCAPSGWRGTSGRCSSRCSTSSPRTPSGRSTGRRCAHSPPRSYRRSWEGRRPASPIVGVN